MHLPAFMHSYNFRHTHRDARQCENRPPLISPHSAHQHEPPQLPSSPTELEVWPRSDDYNWDQPLIQFRASDPGTWQHWIRRINDFLSGESVELAGSFQLTKKQVLVLYNLSIVQKLKALVRFFLQLYTSMQQYNALRTEPIILFIHMQPLRSPMIIMIKVGQRWHQALSIVFCFIYPITSVLCYRRSSSAYLQQSTASRWTLPKHANSFCIQSLPATSHHLTPITPMTNPFPSVYETNVPEEPARAPCSTRNRQEQQLRSPNCDNAMRMWAPCTIDNYYGYADGKPCVFLRLSHVSCCGLCRRASTGHKSSPSHLSEHDANLQHVITNCAPC